MRQSGKLVFVAVNKAEGLDKALVSSEFFSLGFENIYACSSAHGDGVYELLDSVTSTFDDADAEDSDEAIEQGAKVAIVGRPNVGKSSLINVLLFICLMLFYI